MNYTATLPRPDTVSITVSGPSTALAYARALAAKAQGWAGTAVLYVKMALRALTRIPRIVGNIALSALSTKVGYDTVVTVGGKAAGFLGRLASKAVRAIGSGLKAVAGFLTGLLRHVAPKAADTADRLIDKASKIADTVMTTIESTVTGISQVVGVLVRSPLVIVSTIRAAGAASAALVIHALTKGAAAARIVQLVPRAMTAVVWLTNPWKLLLGVVAVMMSATAYSAFRPGRSSTPQGPTPHRPEVADPSLSGEPVVPMGLDDLQVGPDLREAASTDRDSRDDGPDTTSHDVDALVANLRVAIAVDGSIEVHGIPSHLPEDEQRRIAQTAADAAAQQLRRIVRRGRPIRSADRRHVTKAAQAAVLADLDRATQVAGRAPARRKTRPRAGSHCSASAP